MRVLGLAPIALTVGLALDPPRALPAQEHRSTFLGLSAGVATKSDYGLSESQGPAVALTFGRAVSRHVALRLDAEFERFGVKAKAALFFAPCNPDVVCTQMISDVGDGAISTAALLASAEWYERPDRRWLYLLAGFGPQLLASHPDRRRGVHLVVQAGAGFAIPLGAEALLIETRYERALGGGVQPPHVLPVSVGLRFALGRASRGSRTAQAD
jgi:hypothetical protein